MLDRNAFMTPVAPRQQTVTIPQLGGDVIVRGMTVGQRSAFERQFQGPTGKPLRSRQQEFRERLIIATVVDDSGAPLFTVGDVAMLAKQPAEVLEPIIEAAQSVCGMSDSDVEELAKNSEEANETS